MNSTRKDEAGADSGNRSGERIIKKYPNRRLYDTRTSSYITLAEIKQLVMAHEEFAVRDAKTGEDLTRSILLQIILEEEASGSPMFTTNVLGQIIRSYGNAMQGFMGGYLEQNIQALQELQTKNLEQSQQFYLHMQEQLQRQAEKMLQAFGLKR